MLIAKRSTRPTRPDIFTERGITPPWEKDGDVARAQGFLRYEGGSWEERRALIGAPDREPLYADDSHPDSGRAGQIRERAWQRTTKKLERGYRKRSGERVPPDWVARSRDLLALEEARNKDRWPETDSDNPVVRQLVAQERRLLDGRETRKAWRNWLRSALSVDGWLMPRHAVMPDADEFEFREHVVAQLRPDVPVHMGDEFDWHHHFYRLTAVQRPDHEAKLCDKAPRRGQPGYPHKYAIPHKGGAFLPTGHLHPKTGELVVPFRDDEGTYTWHSHLNQSKYFYTPGNTARRLGTNPVARERGWGGLDDLFVFVMEGSLKMCAVVEAGYPAIDAGSVNLWHGGRQVLVDDDGIADLETILELSVFAERHLVGRPVAVVCDSDWHRNDAVWKQTKLVVDVLTAAGAHAVGCAPPEGGSLGWIHPTRRVEMREKVGVDDWLGPEHGGSVLELVCQVPEGAATLTVDDPRLMGGGVRGTYRSRRENAARVLIAMGRRALPGPGNLVHFEQKELSDLLRLPRRTVGDAFQLAVERGLARRLDEGSRYHVDGGVATAPPLCWITDEAMPRHSSPTLDSWLLAPRRKQPFWAGF